MVQGGAGNIVMQLQEWECRMWHRLWVGNWVSGRKELEWKPLEYRSGVKK